MDERPPTPILIAGPTASGKSKLALAVAERFGGAVINADSMQVYRELRVLSARPTPEDEARAPHHLYGFISASDAYSAGRYVSDAARAIAEVRASGLRPIIVGGTGLYFKGLLEGLSPIPAIPVGVRKYWREEAQRRPAIELHQLLCGEDPHMAARLAPSDTQRIVRALEVLAATGRSLAEWQRQEGTPVIDEGDVICFVLRPPRKDLLARAEARFDMMMANGAIEEARTLAGLGLSPELPAMRAIGVRPLLAALSGAMTYEAAAQAAQAETRQYVKRQDTWLRRNMISWKHVEAQEMKTMIQQVFSFIQVKG